MHSIEDLRQIVESDIALNMDLIDIIPSYIVNVKNDMTKLRDALEHKDFISISKISHRIRGCAVSYGFEQIDLMIKDIRDWSEKGDYDLAREGELFLNTFLDKVEIILNKSENYGKEKI